MAVDVGLSLKDLLDGEPKSWRSSTDRRFHSIWVMPWDLGRDRVVVTRRRDDSKEKPMSEPTSPDTPVLDLLARMTADSLEATSLDAQTIALVRLAALVASGAPAASYALNMAAAEELGLDLVDVRGVLTAIAPIVGTARVAEATGRIALAIGVAIEVAEQELADQLDDRP
jgi:hypothetical protein